MPDNVEKIANNATLAATSRALVPAILAIAGFIAVQVWTQGQTLAGLEHTMTAHTAILDKLIEQQYDIKVNAEQIREHDRRLNQVDQHVENLDGRVVKLESRPDYTPRK